MFSLGYAGYLQATYNCTLSPVYRPIQAIFQDFKHGV